MNRTQIYELSQILPKENDFFSGSPFQILAEDDVSYETEKFARCYSNPSFGWHIAKLYADMREPFPICESFILSQVDDLEYETLRSAYMFLRYGEADSDLVFAIALDKNMDPYHKSVLKACILVENVSVSDIASRTGYPEKVVRLYEKLFYNIWDRAEDQLYIASLVNPEGVVNELNPNYQLRASYVDLLKRAGYKNGIDDVLSIAGVRHYGLSGSTQSLVAEFENKLMANAVFLSNIGLLNTRNQVGISNAKNLLAAAKHGGDTELSNNDLIGIGGIADKLVDELTYNEEKDVKRKRAKHMEVEEARIVAEQA
jgi:hypothetical protein